MKKETNIYLKTELCLYLNKYISQEKENKLKEIIIKEINDFLYTKLPDLGIKHPELIEGFSFIFSEYEEPEDDGFSD